MGTTGMYRPPIPTDQRLELSGKGMRKIRSARPDITWLQGPGPCDLWTWTDGQGGIREQELTFFGRTVVYKNGTLLTGLCVDDGAGVMGKTGLLGYDSNTDKDALRAAQKILAAIPEAARSPAVEHLEKMVVAALA